MAKQCYMMTLVHAHPWEKERPSNVIHDEAGIYTPLEREQLSNVIHEASNEWITLTPCQTTSLT